MELNEDLMYHIMHFLDQKELSRCTILCKKLRDDVPKVKQDHAANLIENYWTTIFQLSRIIFDTK